MKINKIFNNVALIFGYLCVIIIWPMIANCVDIPEGSNHPPSFTLGPDQEIKEDAINIGLSNFAQGIKPGPDDEKDQKLTFFLSVDNPDLFSQLPSVTEKGTLSYQPAPDQNGSTTVSIYLKDDGGTENGGVDKSETQTFQITVLPVNDPPSFYKGEDQSVIKNSDLQVVPGWATRMSKGPADEQDQQLTFIVDTEPEEIFETLPQISPDGTLTYKPARDAHGQALVIVKLKDDGGLAHGGNDTSPEQTFTISIIWANHAPSFTKGPDIRILEDAPSQAYDQWATNVSPGPIEERAQNVFFILSVEQPQLFAALPTITSTGKLTFRPNPDANGKTLVSVFLKDDGGTEFGGQDQSDSATFYIDIKAVNDPPEFSPGPDQTIPQNSGTQLVTSWATNISPGPSDEADQNLKFLLTTDQPELFFSPPVILSNGTLQYTPAEKAFGNAVVTVRLQDSGGTYDNGDDTSDPVDFNITVIAVNHAPFFTPGDDITILEDSGRVTFEKWAPMISAGAPEESYQNLTFYAFGNPPEMFSLQPEMLSDGTISFETSPDVNGQATIRIFLKDDGGIENGGKDTSDDYFLDVQITPVNDAPRPVQNTLIVNEDTPTAYTLMAIDVENDPITYDIFLAPQKGSLIIENSLTGKCVYYPYTDSVGADYFEFQAFDHVAQSVPGKVTIEILPVNDAPVISDIAKQTTVEDTPTSPIDFFVSDSDSRFDDLTLVITSDNETLVPNANIVVQGSAGKRSLIITPALNQYGTTVITLRITDNTNMSSQVQFILEVQKRNDPPTLSKINDQIIYEDQTTPPIMFSINDSETPVAELVIQIDSSDPLKIPRENIQLSGIDVNRTMTLKPIDNVSGDVEITVSVFDEDLAVASESFVLQILAVDDPPIIGNIGNQTIIEDESSQKIAFMISDPDTPLDEIAVRAISSDESIIANDQIIISGHGKDRTIQFTPLENQAGAIHIDLIANDGISDSHIKSFNVTITPVNDPPIADTGDNFSIGENRKVYLDASQSIDPENNIIFYQWEQVSGAHVDIDNKTKPKTFFTAPEVGPNGTILVFKLLIIDHDGEQSEDTIEIRIEDMAGQYMIESIAGDNGSIDPSGQLFVQEYSSKTFHIVPQANYDIQDVMINGESIGPVSKYTFYDIQADQTIHAFFIARPKITILAEGNGHVSPQGVLYMNRGDSLTLKLTPDEGHMLDYILIDDIVVAPKTELHCSDIQFDHKIVAYFISKTLFVETEAGKRGSVVPAGKIPVAAGSDLNIQIIPDPGYEVADVQVNGTSVGQVTSHTFHDIRANALLYARFQPVIAQTITASSGHNGHIFPEGEIKVSDGLAQSFVMTPDRTYQVADVFIDNVSIGPMDRYTFPSVEKNYNIHVTFEHQPKISAQAGPNGSIDPNGEVYVKQGWYQEFNIEPNENYEVKDVIVNDKSIGAVSGHIFLEIIDNLSIHAEFQPMPKIYAATNDNGTIAPSGTIIVPTNSFQQFKMTPDPGYRFNRLVVNGRVQPLPEGQFLYTVANITQDYTLNAQFVLDQYTLNASSGAFGSITPTGIKTVFGHESQTYLFFPDTGYEVARVLVDGDNIGRIPSYTLPSIVSDHVIRVEFIKMPQINAEAGAHGQISPEGVVDVHNGDYQLFLIKPDEGYKIASLMVDEQPVSTRLDGIQASNLWKSYVFPNVIENHTISATFDRCTIELHTNGNGQIDPDKDLEFDVLDNVNFSFTPYDGFVIDNVIVDRQPLGARSFYNFWDLTDDHILEVNFRAIEIQTVTMTAGPGGSITPSGTMQIMGGEYAEFMVTPDDMHVLSNILLNGKPISDSTEDNKMLPVGKEGYYVSLNVTSDQTIKATFDEIPKYEIRAISGSHGTIEPSGKVEVLHGQYQLFTFKPDPGFAVKDVQLDNESQGQINSFSLSVMDDHIITVSFYPIHTRVIEGVVVDREAITHGLEHFIVEVWQGDDLLQTTTTNINGEYRFENLPAVDNLVMAAWPPLGNSDFYGSFYNEKKERMYADLVSTLSGNLDDIQFRMQRTFEEGIRGQVRMGDKGVPNIMVDVFEDSATFVKNVTTDENGYYTLTGLDPSEDYKVSVWYRPYATEYFYSISDFSEPGEVVPTTSVLSWDRAKIFRSQYPPLANIDIIIDPGEIISGTVLFPDGSPAPGIRVNAVSDKDQSGNGALTDESGHYTIIGLKKVLEEQVSSDGYIVEIQAVDYPYIAYPQAKNRNLAARVDTGRTDINFQLETGHFISGTVQQHDGNPIEGIQVYARSQKNLEFKSGSAITDSAGHYTIANLPIASDYLVSVISDQYPVHYYADTHQIEKASLLDLLVSSAQGIDFHLTKGPIIHGYIHAKQEIGAEKPLSGVWVNVWSESTQTGGDVVSDHNGYYEITGLVADANDYQVSVIYPGYQPAFYKEIPDDNLMNDTVYKWTDAGHVSPSINNQIQYRNIVLDKGVTFAGMVIFDNQPVTGVTIEIFSDETGGWGSVVSNNRTDANMIITGLCPGIYTLKTTSHDFADTVITGINLEQSIMDYHIPLTLPNRTISGTLIGLKKGEVVRVNAWSSDANCNGFAEVKGSGFATHFQIKGLKPASDYFLETFADNYPRQIYDGRSNILSADLIDVAMHDVSTVVFRFEDKGSIEICGNVTFPQDAQRGDAVRVEAWSESTDAMIETNLTFLENHVMAYTLVGNAPAIDYDVRVVSDQFIDMSIPAPVNTVENSLVTDLNFILSRGTQISGRITNDQNQGINQLSVIAWSDTLKSGSQGTTLPDGHFTVSGLAEASDYRLEIIHDLFGQYYFNNHQAVREHSQATLLNTHSGNISDIVVVIPEGVFIQGYVSDTNGKVLSGIWVDAWSASTQSGNGVFTDMNGFFKIQGLSESNDYLIRVLPEHQYLPDEKHNISAPCDALDFRLTETKGFRVIGTVYNCDEQPLQLARVEFQSANNAYAYGWALTSSDGSYEIKQIPQSTDYIITVLPPDNSESAFMRLNSISIQADKRIDIHMEPELMFSGKLTDQNTHAPIADANVVVFSASNGFWDETHSNADGIYELHHVPAGKDYMIIINAPDYLESKKTGQTPGVDIDFELETGGTISGVVKVASTGKGMPDVPVEVYSVSNAGLSNFGGIATTDANGFFQVSQLKINDHQGFAIDDYVVFIYPDYYPPQSRGNKTTGEIVNFVVAGGEANETSGTVPRFENPHQIVIDVFENDGPFVTCVKANTYGSFYVSGLHLNKKYQYRFLVQFNDTGTSVVQWAGENDMGVDNREDAFAYGVPSTINFEFHDDTRKRNASPLIGGPGPVQNLRSSSHAFQTINHRKRTITASGPEAVSNDPSVSVGWDPPADSDSLAGYYGFFTDEADFTFSKFNTDKKSPIRTRKITSRDLEGDDVNYYFHVAAVDIQGRVGNTSSIAFRIDTVPPTNVSVIAPDFSKQRNIQIQLGAGGASEMYISSESYQNGGVWEKLAQKREWQLTPGNGEKPIYVRFRDKAGNTSQTLAKTRYTKELQQYTIQLIAEEHGSMSPSGTLIKEKGENLSVEIIPDKNYQIKRLTLDGKALSSNKTAYTLENIQADHLLAVSFEKSLFKIVSSAGDHGQVVPDGQFFAEKGSSQAFMITPDKGYSVDQILLDMMPVNWTGSPFIMPDIAKGHQLFVSFTRAYTMTTSTDSHGHISPNGEIQVAEGHLQQFQFHPDKGYDIDKVLVDGSPVEVIQQSLTLYNVQKNYDIQAFFKKVNFTIDSMSGQGGVIDPEGSIVVEKNNQQIFHIQPNDGFEIEKLLIDGIAVQQSDTYTFTDMTSNHSIAASFQSKQFIVHTTSGPNGTIAPQGDIAVDWGEELILIIEPASNYAVDQVLLDNQPVTLTAGYYFTLTDIHANHDFSVSFKRVHQIVSIVSGDGQTMPSGIVMVEQNQRQDFEIIPDIGHKLDKFQIDDAYVSIDDLSYTFESVIRDHQLIATFAPIPVKITATSGANGKISPAGIITYDMFSEATFFLNANPGFEVASLSIDGNTIPYTRNSYLIESVDRAYEIAVEYQMYNYPPAVSDATFLLMEDASVCGKLKGMDGDGDRVTFEIVTMPEKGNAIITKASEGLFCYTPNANADGTDQFIFLAKDYSKSSNMGIVTLKIQPQNDAPQAMNDQWTATEDSLLHTHLSAMDIDADPLTYSLVSQATLGQAILVDRTTGEVKYQPKPDVSGSDKIQFQVSDGRLVSNIADVNIWIDPVNDAPIAYSRTVETGRGQSVALTLPASDIENDPLDYQIVSPPIAGTLTPLAHGIYAYKPDTGFIGTDQFSFQVNDGAYTSNTARVSIIIGTISAITNEEQAVTLNVLYGATIIENVLHGETQWVDQVLIYTPSTNFVGYDTLRYQNPGDPVIREIVIRIEPINDAPIIHEIDTVIVNEDDSQSISIDIEDPDGDAITLTFTSPEHGTLVDASGTLTYYPDENYHGSDYFIVRVSDGIVVATREITISVLSKNDIPVIGKLQTIEVLEDHAIDITIVATDVDQDELLLQIVDDPTHGQIYGKTLDMMHLNYTPSPNFEGWDHLSIHIFDGLAHSETKQISIHVLGVNDTPSAKSMQLNGIENTEITAQLEGFDIEGQALAYNIFAQAANGIVRITPSTGECVYMPSKDFVGNDEFSFTVHDGYTRSTSATVTISVKMGNRPPDAENGSLETSEDESVNYTLTATDINNDTLIYRLVSPPTLGQLQLIDSQTGQCKYIPSPDKNGTDLFTFVVSDGVLDSNIATVTVEIKPVNDRPQAQDSNLRLDEDFEKQGVLNGSDIDGDTLHFEIVENPSMGIVEWIDSQAGKYRYSPFLNHHGTDLFRFVVKDKETASLTGTVHIIIDPQNDVPIATPLSFETIEDTHISGLFQASDLDEDPLTFMLVDDPSAISIGILEITDVIKGEFTYYPPKNQYGQFVFKYYVSDGQLSSPAVPLTINVLPANDAPVVFDQDLSTDMNAPLTINLSGEDIDEDHLIYNILFSPSNGELIKDGNAWKYIPDTDFQGVDFFTFQADDQSGSDTAKSNTGTVDIRVGVPEADFYTYEDNKKSLDLLSGTHFDSDVLRYEIEKLPDHGVLKGEGQFQTYEPETNYFEMDHFTVRYTVGNQKYDRDVQVYIIPVNDPPKLTGVVPFPVFTYEDQSLTLTVSVFDPDTLIESLNFSLKDTPNNGQARITGNIITYQPSKDFSGEDQLTVSVTDGFDGSSSAQKIDIQIAPANDAPVAFDQEVDTLEETQVSITPMAFDQDSDTLVYTIKQNPSKGRLLGQSPPFTYVPQANFYGTDRLTFVASDGESMSEEAEIIIHVKNVNDAPKANSASFTIHDEKQITDRLLAMDADYDILVYTLVKQPEKGLLTFINPVMGTFIYYPHTGASGIDTFSFKVNDGSKDSNIAAVSITIDSNTTDNQFANVNVTISAPYAPYVTSCTYLFINADTGQMIINGNTLTDTINTTLPKGNYRLILLAPDYRPYEYQKQEKHKYFILDEDIDLTVSLTPQQAFNPHPPGADISHMITPDGIKIWAVKKNMDADDQFYMHIQTRSGEIPVDHADISGDGSSNAPYSYDWTPSSPWTSYENNRYEITFIFYGGAYGHAEQLDTMTIQWQESHNRKRTVTHTDIITHEFGQSPMYISQGDSAFYPLAGTDCHTTLMDNTGIERHMTIHIPPIPLEYLYIDDSYGNNGGQLNYDLQTDRFHPDPFQSLQTVAPDQKLRVEVYYYTFGFEKAGNGISISFYMADGDLAGKPVRYNPILMNDASRMHNAPAIVLPVYLNKNSSILSGITNLQDITPEIRINEVGDGLDGFRSENEDATVEDDGLVYIEMNHLTMVGLDVVIAKNSTASSSDDDSSSGCFVESVAYARWHEIFGLIIICFLIGLIMRIKNETRSS
jgi:VCBS repeat-containing protein